MPSSAAATRSRFVDWTAPFAIALVLLLAALVLLPMFRLLMTAVPKVPVDSKAMNLPLALIDGLRLSDAPEVSVTRVVWFVWRSRRKTSMTPLPSAPPGRRLLAAEAKTTNRPSALMPGLKLPALAWVPSLATLTRSV